MQHKYIISKSDNKQKLVIKEFAELEKNIFTLVYESFYDADAVQSALATDNQAVISTLRTDHMFPTTRQMSSILNAVTTMYTGDGQDSMELLFDDIDSFLEEQAALESEEKVVAEQSEIETLISEPADNAAAVDKSSK